MGTTKEARKERDQRVNRKRQRLADLRAKVAELERKSAKLEKEADKNADKLKSVATYLSRPIMARQIEIGCILDGLYDKIFPMHREIRSIEEELAELCKS